MNYNSLNELHIADITRVIFSAQPHFQLTTLATPRHGLQRKHHSSIVVPLLRSYLLLRERVY
jgi:hypothetical protein